MKSKKMVISAAVLGMVLTGSAGVYAGSNLEQIKAYLNNGLKIELNGSAYTLVDGNGAKQAPITYKGSTYLPVRSIADALNVPVTYDAGSNKVTIGSSSSTGGGGTDSNVYTGQRPKYLPADFPIPKDAKIKETVENNRDNKKSVYFVYETKNGLDSLGVSYKAYFQTKELTDTSEDVNSNSLTMVGKKGDDLAVTITGAPDRDKEGYYEITVVWSGK
ncbi:hypothetical protein BBD42_19655 [Paenibacillus sp. BIHB 4019]|uniref:Copper amine oxidase-like N-terminal domain-containing protein n=1 Tax=Paenibacillus sp. BIHB 4019 TaxID=1870819 RepID=A0A1B2DL48_9BACL|nr:stalk domain-containing protein [Paenibacillus sp. BIHB 4019]ANY68440.1 hypothetical protein BBD42_19655 [Paenibacillus sp. BIHB 4019]